MQSVAVPGLNLNTLWQGFNGVYVVFHSANLGALPLLKFSICGSKLSDIIVTWSVHLSCVSFKRVGTLYISAFLKTNVSELVSCHLIFLGFFSLNLYGIDIVSWHAVFGDCELMVATCLYNSIHNPLHLFLCFGKIYHVICIKHICLRGQFARTGAGPLVEVRSI